MTRIIPVIVFLVAFSSVIVAMTIGMISSINEWPYNPLRWAQERRRQANRRRLNRISDLEHELGYRPCSNETCMSCMHFVSKRANALSAEGNRAVELEYDIVKQAYDKQIDMALLPRPIWGRGTSSGGPR